MDKHYADTVRLLLNIAPDVFDNDIFAMKGGTAIAQRVERLGIQTRLIRSKDLGDTKLIAENEASQVKVEVNVVFRGTVLPIERRPLSARTGDLFGVEIAVPALAQSCSSCHRSACRFRQSAHRCGTAL